MLVMKRICALFLLAVLDWQVSRVPADYRELPRGITRNLRRGVRLPRNYQELSRNYGNFTLFLHSTNYQENVIAWQGAGAQILPTNYRWLLVGQHPLLAHQNISRGCFIVLFERSSCASKRPAMPRISLANAVTGLYYYYYYYYYSQST